MQTEIILEQLQNRGFHAEKYTDKKQVRERLLTLIPSTAKIGFGGSKSVESLGVIDSLISRGNTVYHHAYWTQGGDLNELARHADFYLLSANALTSAGEIVNTDGRANRIACSVDGPKNIVFVVGKNKIVADLEAAFRRIREVAAPLNARRLHKKTPCIDGPCNESACPLSETICRASLILHRPTTGKNVTVLICDEDMGF